MVAGCAARLSTPPRDSASEKSSIASTNRATAGVPPSSSMVTIAPKPRCCLRASAWPGCDARPGYSTRCTPLRPSSQDASAFALASCKAILACRVRRPRSVRKLSKAAPVTPVALAHQASCWWSSADAATTAPPMTSLWPLRYLVVEWTTMSAPSASGCCSTGDRKVLSTATFAPALRASATVAATSVIRSNGLLGDSIQTSAAGRSSAAASAAASP